MRLPFFPMARAGPPGLTEPLAASPLLGRTASAKRQFWCALSRRGNGFAASRRVRPVGADRRGAVTLAIEALAPRPDRLLAQLQVAPGGAPPPAVVATRGVRERAAESLPPELDAQLERCEPQFFLRNTPRCERFPDDDLEFKRHVVIDRHWDQAIKDVHATRYRAPELLGETSCQFLGGQIRDHRALFVTADWRRHFGRELRDHVEGPLWRYDPDAPPPDPDAGAETP